MGLREQKKRETRDRLVAAAAELFSDKGFEATTVNDIVAKANISRMTFFNHFAGKEGVLEQVAVDWFQEHGALFMGMIGGEDTILAAIPPQLEERLDLIIEHRPFLRMVVTHTRLFTGFHVATAEIAAYLSAHFETRLDRVRQAQSNGAIRKDLEASEVCHLYDAIRNDVLGRWLMEDDTDGDVLKERFANGMKVFLHGLSVEERGVFRSV